MSSDDAHRRREQPADGLATALVVVACAIGAATVALDLSNAAIDLPAGSELEPGWTAVLTGLAMVVPGALLTRLMRRHPVAWVLVGFGFLWLLDGLAVAWAVHALYVDPGAPLAAPAYWFFARFGAMLLLGLPLLLLLFPDGRLPEHRVWRRVSVASLALTGVLPLVLLVVPSAVVVRYHGMTLPPEIAALTLDAVSADLPYDVWAAVLTAAYAAAAASLVVPFAVTVHRYRSATGDRRLQMRWLVWAALVDVCAVMVASAVPDPIAGLSLSVAVAVTSAAVVVAVTRYRLYDVDRLLSATVVYGLLVALVVVIDVVVFATAGSLLGERDAALVAIAVVAVVYAPLRARLWILARRLVRGGRDDPYAAVSTLAQRLEVATGPQEQLQAAARSLAEAFRLPYVRVELERVDGGQLVVEHGAPPHSTVSLPVAYRGEEVGRLVLSLGGQSGLSERDQRLLGDLVRQAVVAARASELNAALQHHREQLVLAREEERRRIRRDLHDGLGPTLGAVSLRIEAARNLAGQDPVAADQMLREATGQVRDVLADVRRLVHDLRPPALDERGLLGALQQLADGLSGEGLEVTVNGDAGLAALPAAVEVAAYRIVSEALANVRRHARASRCEVALRVAEQADGTAELLVSVLDDGVGPAKSAPPGVGTVSMRERASALGGRAAMTAAPGGGTLVVAHLPVSPAGGQVDALAVQKGGVDG